MNAPVHDQNQNQNQKDLERRSTTQVSTQYAPDTAQVCVWDATGNYFCEKKESYARQSASQGHDSAVFERFATAFRASSSSSATPGGLSGAEGFCGCGADIPN